jgi:hypothetical protein
VVSGVGHGRVPDRDEQRALNGDVRFDLTFITVAGLAML